MSKYETACDFYGKADYEGGLAEMVIGYGVSENDVPPEVYEKAQALAQASDDFERAVEAWHESPGGCAPDPEYPDDECPW